MNIDEHRIYIQRIRTLPSLPVIFQKVLETIEDPLSSAKDLKQVILKDQSICAKILNLANSAYFGYPKEIKDISTAIVVLGFDTVKRVALGVSLMKIFDNQEGNHTGFDREGFWIYSIGCAQAARLLARRSGMASQLEAAYLLGLLHGIGIVVLDHYFHKEFTEILETIRTDHVTIRDAEQAVLGFDHSEIALWLGERWKFPDSILIPITYHYKLSDCPYDYLYRGCLIHASDFLMKKCQIGNGGDELEMTLHAKARKILKLTDDAITELLEELESKRENIEMFVRAVQ